LVVLAVLLCLLSVTVGLAAGPKTTDLKTCAQCHAKQAAGWNKTAHAKGNVTCFACHKAETLHDQPTADVNAIYDTKVCAGCHGTEYQEWQASGHNRPVPYTQDEILPDLITDCVRCHNVAGYVQVSSSGKPFATSKGEVAAANSQGVTCAVCHDPHSAANPSMLRAGDRAQTCDNCHGGKWQNLVLNGTGGQRYADSSYDKVAKSPHDTGNRCVSCHMSRTSGVNAGGHTLKMRDDKGQPNVSSCVTCHKDVKDFNVGGKQAETRALLDSLSETMKGRNAGELPRNQPGKCNECHRGGTEPFRNDPDGRLEQAFQNYRLFLNDRSLGVHNPAYTRQMLQDSIKHIS
jgi:predicted CXXCH cytochrome family protein